jgi:hypothetical protein
MKIIQLLFLIISPVLSYGQGFLPLDTIKTPKEIKEIIPDSISLSLYVDFNGDNKRDYICKTEGLNKSNNEYLEYWITSDFKIIKKIPKYYTDIEYRWFVNIDSDKEPEILSASGWSEGVDYCFIDQDFKSQKDSILFYFNPIIIDNNKEYWGYPWAIKNLIIRKEKNRTLIFSSLIHEIVRDGEITKPSCQSVFPLIGFSGYQQKLSAEIGEKHNLEWVDFKELIKQTHKTQMHKP